MVRGSRALLYSPKRCPKGTVEPSTGPFRRLLLTTTWLYRELDLRRVTAADRQARMLPRGHAAGDVQQVGEAGALEDARRDGRAVAAEPSTSG